MWEVEEFDRRAGLIKSATRTDERKTMRVYHFLSAEHGLDDLWKRRLKVSTFDKINDPFELNAIQFQLSRDQYLFQSLKENYLSKIGMICFSKCYDNPVQWSHYADRHRGICLGFDIEYNEENDVNYVNHRAMIENFFARSFADQEKTIYKILTTKFEHWKYEKEHRVFMNLSEIMLENGFYFRTFDENILLREVLIGPKSEKKYRR